MAIGTSLYDEEGAKIVPDILKKATMYMYMCSISIYLSLCIGVYIYIYIYAYI